jgi:hypothetical protein
MSEKTPVLLRHDLDDADYRDDFTSVGGLACD